MAAMPCPPAVATPLTARAPPLKIPVTEEVMTAATKRVATPQVTSPRAVSRKNTSWVWVVSQRCLNRPARYPPAAADNHCVMMSHMVLATVKLLAERPWPDQGETEASPSPAPKVTKTTERATAATAPARIAPQDAARLARKRVLSSNDADESREDKKQRFTALLHHVYDIERLRAAFLAIKRDASAGVDGETWEHYRESLEDNLQDLSLRLKRGAYRARPVRRVFIPKDGGRRPLGVPVLEDKIVQHAVVEVLNAIYEEDFLGFSYGFRPKRSPHQALDALTVGITTKKVNSVLDADLRSFFDTLKHAWLVQFYRASCGR